MVDDLEELMKKVSLLEIKARQLSLESFSGEYHSLFKGQGLDFEDFREYQHGDEIRFIDWNVTARMSSPHVRNFHEERELSVLIAVDISSSGLYTSSEYSKRRLAAEIAAVLAFSAKNNGGKVGLLLFTDHAELYLPPAKGVRHTLRMIRELLAFEPKAKTTSLSEACHFISKTLTRKSLVFLMSDFIDDDFHKKLGVMSAKHETTCIRIYDPVEESLPRVGKVSLVDAETGHQAVVNTNNANVRMGYRRLKRRQLEGLNKMFRKYQIANVSVSTDQDYLPALQQLFRSSRRG